MAWQRITTTPENVLEFIKGRATSPTIKEIGEQFQISGTSVRALLTILERNGRIKRTPDKMRGIRVLR